MIVAITGASGFIGKKLVQEHLAMNHEVRVLARNISLFNKEKVRAFQGDLLNANLTNFVSGVDVLYHCAGEIKDKSKIMHTNYGGTKRLFRLSRGNVKKWIQLSSIGVYGQHKTGIIDENCIERPSNIYEESKFLADKFLLNNSKNYDIDVCILRPSNIYSHEMSNRSIFDLITAINKSLFFYIGKKIPTSHYTHVNDLVRALILCSSSPKAIGQVYNLSYESTFDILISAICNELEIDCKIRHFPEWLARGLSKFNKIWPSFPLTKSRIDNLTSIAVYTSNRIEKELGFVFNYSLSKGMPEMIRKWRENNL